MINLPINTTVQIKGEELGRVFAASMSYDQAEFLIEAANICEKYNWSKQSYMILKDMTEHEIEKVIRFLEILLSHLKEE